jgi:hypothetical protein
MIADRELGSYWYRTSTPTFFLELLKRKNILDFPENPEMTMSSLDRVDIANIELTPWFFSTKRVPLLRTKYLFFLTESIPSITSAMI